MELGWTQLPMNYVIVNTGYAEGWEKNGIKVYFTRDGMVNIYEEDGQNLSLEDLMWIYNRAKLHKG